jgi:hypothetical protein
MLASQPVVAYVAAEFLDLGQNNGNAGGSTNTGHSVLTPAAAGTYKLGLNALTNGGPARQEAERGCRYFLCMNDFTGASQLKRAFPDAIVMVRRFFEHGALPSADQIMNGLEGATDKNLIYTGLNEADQIGQDGNALRNLRRRHLLHGLPGFHQPRDVPDHPRDLRAGLQRRPDRHRHAPVLAQPATCEPAG